MKIRKLGLVSLSLLAAATLAACSSSSAPADNADSKGDGDAKPVTLRVQSQPSIAAEPLFIGDEKGFFEEEGITIEIVELPDLSAATAALQAGKLDLAFSPTISALQMTRQNVPVTLVAPSDGINPKAAEAPKDEQRNYTSAGLYVSKESGITDLEGLADASIAVPELKGQPDGTITSVLQEAGVKTDKIEWLALGFVPALESLKNGQVDAAFLVSPFSLDADDAGLTRIMNPSVEFFPPGTATSAWAAEKGWAEKNGDTIERFQRALKKSAEWSNENIDEVKAHAIERAKLKLTADQMPQSYWPSEFDQAQLEEVDEKLVDIKFFDKPADVGALLYSAK